MQFRRSAENVVPYCMLITPNCESVMSVVLPRSDQYKCYCKQEIILRTQQHYKLKHPGNNNLEVEKLLVEKAMSVRTK